MMNNASIEMTRLGSICIDCPAGLAPCPVGLGYWSSGNGITRPIEHD